MNPIPKYRYWSYFLLVAGFSFVCAATLSPFNFIVRQLSLASIVEGFRFGSYIKDYWQNILLFIPWGFGLAAVIASKERRTSIILTIALFGSAILSTTVELAQFFLPSRISNLTDIIFNTFGGGLGGWFYYYRGQIINLFTGKINLLGRKFIAKVIGVYCLIIALAIFILLISVNLSNWENYYLVFGNEVTGDRPWDGYIKSVYISDRIFNSPQINTAFADPNIFSQENLVLRLDDQLSQLSNFVWMQSTSENNPKPLIKDGINKITNKGIALNKQQWLITPVPATDLVNRLKQSNKFTISLSFATNNLDQTGPARIISLSQDIYAQNLVIAQQKSNLHFRLRTPITGRNATHPELVISDVFADRNLHQILITFADRELNFYLDSPNKHYSFLFAPSNSFMAFIPWNMQGWQINLKDDYYQYKWLYLIIIIPIVFLFGMHLKYEL